MRDFIHRMGVIIGITVVACGCDSGIDYSMIPTGSPSDSTTPAPQGTTSSDEGTQTDWNELENVWSKIKNKIPNPFLTQEEKQRLLGEREALPPEPVTVIGGGLAAVFKAPSDEATFAVFNGRIVRPGDQVDDKKVLAIEEDELRLVGPDQTIYIYRLKEPAS